MSDPATKEVRKFGLPLRYIKGHDNEGRQEGVAGTIRNTAGLCYASYHVLRVWGDWENEKVIDEFAELVTKAVNSYAADQAELASLRSGLKEIAESEHQQYEKNADSSYGTGVADGHRCAANMARAALSLSKPEG